MDLEPLQFVLAVLAGYFGVVYIVLAIQGLLDAPKE